MKDADHDEDEAPWHERTSTVVGASAGAIAVIGLLWLLISYVVGGSDDPGTTSQYYPDPSFSDRSSASTTGPSGETTSTETITSTSPPVTTDIDPGATTTSGTDTSTTPTTTSFNPSNLPRTRASTTYDDGRQRPRLNETRTLYPRP
ncbi:hypothetical protein [Mycobacterium sp. Root135]|uniref:hypothetical protein n=1 Tax=Mycobacterium sp. Root135 TaxID=1736457 RepID=UPI0009EA8662|nr:hypothetical protein [Mycobacterium sp. Root135]